jgi:3-phenylpropionate/cinnamic acid dioxygenase small subunit
MSVTTYQATALGDWSHLLRVPARDERFAAVADFYATESELLDDGLLEAWLADIVADEIDYIAPVRVTRSLGAGTEFLGTMNHLNENRASLAARIARGATGVAWAEDPPSRARRHVSGLRVFESPDGGSTLWARMNVLLTRNRFDRPEYELISYERRDSLVDPERGYRLRHRMALVDQSCLGTVNLAIFL